MVARTLCETHSRDYVGGYVSVGTWEEQREMRRKRVDNLADWHAAGSDLTACNESEMYDRRSTVCNDNAFFWNIRSVVVDLCPLIVQNDCGEPNPDDYDDYGCP
jgi:hypothetical protein